MEVKPERQDLPVERLYFILIDWEIEPSPYGIGMTIQNTHREHAPRFGKSCVAIKAYKSVIPPCGTGYNKSLIVVPAHGSKIFLYL